MPLQFIVPARRAVVTSEMTYEDALRAWSAELGQRRDALVRWYFDASEGPLFDEAKGRLDGWIGAHFQPDAAQVHAATESTATVRAIRPMMARLWKGPLRVLLEAAYTAAHPPPDAAQAPPPSEPPPSEPPAEEAPAPTLDDEDLDPNLTMDRRAEAEPPPQAGRGRRRRGPPADEQPPTVTPVTHVELGGRTLELRVNARREVTNPDARFLPGDVVEFPLFKLLALAGKGAYSSLSFNPDGHFFLCNTVQGEGAGAVLHDNRIAMRFQALVAAGRAAFYALDTDLFGAGAQQPPLASVCGHRVTARGMIYGGSLAMSMGASSRLNHGKQRWWITDYNWGTGTAPKNLPSVAGLATLQNGPLTPSWACSPCMLFFLYFMLNMYSGSSPRGGGVGPEVQHDDSPLRTHADRFVFENPPRRGADAATPSSADTSSVLFGGPPVERDARNRVVRADWQVPPEQLAPVSVFSLSHHEQSAVTLRSHAKLVELGGAGQPPVTGFLAAYEPLGGEPVPMPDGRDEGLFDMQAAGQLKVARVSVPPAPGTYSGMSCRTFKFAPMDANGVRLFRDTGGDIGISVSQAARRGASTGLHILTRLHPDALDTVHSATPDYKPLAFSKGIGTGPVGLPEQFHAERAVPYPTMAEAQAFFPDLATVEATRARQVTALQGMLATMRAGLPPDPPEGAPAAEVRAAQRAHRDCDALESLIGMLTASTTGD